MAVGDGRMSGHQIDPAPPVSAQRNALEKPKGLPSLGGRDFDIET